MKTSSRVASGAVCTWIAVFGSACSSSASPGEAPDTGVFPHDAAVHDTAAHETGARGGAVADAHSTKDAPPPDARLVKETGTPGEAGSDAPADGPGTECPPPDPVDYTPPAFARVVTHPGACSAAAIADFVAACGFTSGGVATCAAWQAANVTDGGVSCGSCIDAPNNTGAIRLDPGAPNHSLFASGFPNTAGCFQVLDPIHGPACAGPYNNLFGCLATACEPGCRHATDPNALSNCQSEAEVAGCAPYVSGSAQACIVELADGGAANTCSPSFVTTNLDDDFTFVIGVICGGSASTDGGAQNADAKPD